MLQLRVACAYRGLPKCILISQRRFISERTKPSKYKTDVESSITMFKKELGAVQANKKRESMKRKIEEQNEIQKMRELNKRENKKIADQRAERVAKENEARLARRMKGDENRAAIRREVLQEQTRRVENAIKQSSTFITRENLDQRIEEILDTPTNFDFCLTKSGKKITDKK